MVKKLHKTTEALIKELDDKRKELETKRKQELQRFYELIGCAFFKEIEEKDEVILTGKSGLVELVEKHINKKSDIVFLKQELGIIEPEEIKKPRKKEDDNKAVSSEDDDSLAVIASKNDD